ncbi:MAG: hypothetical protein C4536_15045 [Actinobacteria bacterium]|jgi:hypothetical protein|nr:MAG: hypothetical protein C4536_15045 [Actinomycetota bacterium]
MWVATVMTAGPRWMMQALLPGSISAGTAQEMREVGNGVRHVQHTARPLTCPAMQTCLPM